MKKTILKQLNRLESYQKSRFKQINKNYKIYLKESKLAEKNFIIMQNIINKNNMQKYLYKIKKKRYQYKGNNFNILLNQIKENLNKIKIIKNSLDDSNENDLNILLHLTKNMQILQNTDYKYKYLTLINKYVLKFKALYDNISHYIEVVIDIGNINIHFGYVYKSNPFIFINSKNSFNYKYNLLSENNKDNILQAILNTGLPFDFTGNTQIYLDEFINQPESYKIIQKLLFFK